MFEWFTKNSGGISRLTGFTFHGGNSGGNDGYNGGHLLIAGNSRQLRVDHNKFIPTRSAMVFFRGNIGGVVDHNTIQLSRGWFKFAFYAMHDAWNGIGNYGDAAWAADTNFGSADFLFFEDNTFQNDDGHMYAQRWLERQPGRLSPEHVCRIRRGRIMEPKRVAASAACGRMRSIRTGSL